MTIKLFAKITGIDYWTVASAVAESEYHVKGKNVEYRKDHIREAVMDHLKDKERKLEHKLAEVRRGIVSAHDVGGEWP